LQSLPDSGKSKGDKKFRKLQVTGSPQERQLEWQFLMKEFSVDPLIVALQSHLKALNSEFDS
jgi:hypothetical protein